MDDVSVNAAVDAVVGRDRELHSIDEFLDAPLAAPAGLVLEGEPGIGKSTLWRAAVAAARERGLQVLVSRPAEADRGLALMGIGDLLDPVLDGVIDRLTPPRRRALEVALLRESGEEAVDDRALAVAVRDILRLLNARRPVVIAVDDAHWLDASTTRTLAFALRRVDASIRLIITRRREPSELEQTIEVEHLAVGPLDVGPLHRLLAGRLDRTFAHQTLMRIHAQSGGNPIFALELARVAHDGADPLAPPPVPPTLAELMRTRLAAVPTATRDVLAYTAALGTPSVSVLRSLGADPQALDPAIIAGLVERESGTIRFTHPLLSSVLYDDLGTQRRVVHERIAAVVTDPVMRARHLALATDEPDATVATALEEAAAVAADRGASASAAELAEGALRLTPSADEGARHRRALAAARAEKAAGEWTRARKLADDLLSEDDLGPLRAEALLLLAEFEGLGRAVVLLEEALQEAASRPALQAAIQCRLAWTTRHIEGFDAALVRSKRALEMAEAVDDDALRVRALSMMTMMGFATGDPEAPTYARREYDIAVASGDPQLIADAVLDHAEASGSNDAARVMVERAYEDVRDRDELQAAEALRTLAAIQLDRGRWDLAADYAARAFELHVQYGLEVPWIHLPFAEILLDRGELEAARAHCERALQLAQEQFGFPTPVHLGTMGVITLRSGDPRGALGWFEKAAETTTRLGWRDAFARWWVPDRIEALLALDRIDDAEHVLGDWAAGARAGDQVVPAHILRCRGLIAAARGDTERAASLLEEAVAGHERADDTFGRARSLLALGVVRRRQRRKRDAAEAIFAAIALFEQLGAATWIADARTELGTIGGRTRTEGLTPAEHRVAALVAKGRTNQEVAAELFLRVATIETHLSHAYAKLGVHSRTELALVYRPDVQSMEQSSGKPMIST